MIANIEVQVDELPALRSTLRLAQTLVPVPPVDSESSFGPRYDLQHLDRLQHLINEVDRHLDAGIEDRGHPEVPIAQVLFGATNLPENVEATIGVSREPFEAHWTGEPEASESHFVGIDPGVPDGKPLHFIQNADGTMRLGLRPGETYVGRVRGHNALGSGPSSEFEITTPEDAEAFETARLVANGGWCSPADEFYRGVEIPEVTARRGGLSFTKGPDFRGLTKGVTDMTKKELRAEIDRLNRQHRKALDAERARVRKLRKRNRRLLRLIEKGL